MAERKMIVDSLGNFDGAYRPQEGEVAHAICGEMDRKTSRDNREYETLNFQYGPDRVISLIVGATLRTQLEYFQVAKGDEVILLCTGYLRGFPQWQLVANKTVGDVSKKA